MTVVADAGPLIALAKIGGLGTLFNLYPQIVTPQAVYDEAVREGHRVLAPDAALLQAEYDAGHLLVEAIQNPLTTATRQLGRGERESIQLALQRRADWLLVDDFEARKSAIKAFASSAARTRVKGTLGIVTSAYIEGSVSLCTRSVEKRSQLRASINAPTSAACCLQTAWSARNLSR